ALRGVVHAAGVLDDGVLSGQSAERFARVLRPKVGGACHLDVLTRSADLDFFVLFSSIMGTLGSAGQGGYTAANAGPDALAARRPAAGVAGRGPAWGLRGWRRGGTRRCSLVWRGRVGAGWIHRRGLRCAGRRGGEAKRSSCRCRSSWVC